MRTASIAHPVPVRGFTIIELLLVVALVTGTMVLAAPIFSGLVVREDLRAQADLAADALREAQSAAMTGKGSGAFGVQFETDRFVLFEGATYNVADPDNVVRVLPAAITMTGAALAGGGNAVLYADHRGTTAQAGTITFADGEGTTAVVIAGEAGLIETQ